MGCIWEGKYGYVYMYTAGVHRCEYGNAGAYCGCIQGTRVFDMIGS